MKNRWIRMLSGIVVLLVAAAASGAPSQPPSFIVIVADDMGWSDIGAFGGEIRTPALDALAGKGVAMTRFYVAPTCSPTRAMLMTGVDSHLAGLGTMEGVQADNQRAARGYAGQLHGDVVTIAEALRASGYVTLMSGKWHLAKQPAQYPDQRGFDRSFALIEGGASHFSDAVPLYRSAAATYLEDGVAVDLPKDFYSSKTYTDKMLEYLDTLDDGTPFFAYVAYTAPHDPLQVPTDWIDRYAGAYDAGPGAIRERRTRGLVERGLIPADVSLWSSPVFPAFLPAHVQPWAEMDAQARRIAPKPMQIYASMVEYMDAQIQRLVSALERSGRLDNTYIIFLSDNGANGATPLSYPGNTRSWYLERFSQAPDAQGLSGSHTYLGREWASASAAPFKLYKGAVAEGGIRSAMIVRGPLVAKNRLSGQVSHITDLATTLYELAGIDPRSNVLFKGKYLPEGVSLLANWQNPDENRHRTFATELFGHRAVISGRWKATNMRPPLGSGQWELYDLHRDPGETTDVAAEHPEELQALREYYASYRARVDVIPPDPPVAVSFGDLFTKECSWFCQLITDLIDFIVGLWMMFAPVEQ